MRISDWSSDVCSSDLVLPALCLVAEPQAWLGDPVLSMAAVIAVDVWKATPFVALLALAALQVLPQDLYEAARIDGAGRIRIFFSITLPLIRPALFVAIIFRGLDALRVFDVIYVLTGNSASTARSEEHTSELQSLMRISSDVFCLKKKNYNN